MQSGVGGAEPEVLISRGDPRPGALTIWVKAVRIHQWSKNTLLLVPALAAHLQPTPGALRDLLTAVTSFSLLASALYIVNDLRDLDFDRQHPLKRNRPLASGSVGRAGASLGAAVLLLVSLALALTLPIGFIASWATYMVLSSAYSLALKRVVVLDVVVLAALYTVRVVAGAAAVELPLSRWFLAFSVFLFTSLALLKRLVETQRAGEREVVALAGRGWVVGDAPVLLAFGAGSAVASALVYCLYITGSEVLRTYARPDMLWLGLPVLLYWIARVWLLAFRGDVHEDPILFALRDKVSYVVLGVVIAIIWMAT